MSRKRRSRKKVVVVEQVMQCSPQCPYFPNMECDHWEYDKTEPYIKRRVGKKDFRCCYDGHKITSWYETCPKKKEEEISKTA